MEKIKTVQKVYIGLGMYVLSDQEGIKIFVDKIDGTVRVFHDNEFVTEIKESKIGLECE